MKTKNMKKLIVNIFILLTLTSCASTQIPKPRSESDALVVVPKLIIDTRGSFNTPKYKLHMVLEETDTKEEFFIILNELSKDYQFTKQIPPGTYYIKELNNNYNWRSNYTFSKYLQVEAGKMNVLPYKIVFLIDNNYWRIYYPELKDKDMDRILSVLGSMPNFSEWKVNQ